MKTPRWSVLIVAILLGLVTGDFLQHAKTAERTSEVNAQVPQAHAELQLEPFYSSEN